MSEKNTAKGARLSWPMNVLVIAAMLAFLAAGVWIGDDKSPGAYEEGIFARAVNDPFAAKRAEAPSNASPATSRKQ